MAGRRTAMAALSLTGEVERRLVALGCDRCCMPSQAVIFAEVWPLAAAIRRAEKLARRARKHHKRAGRIRARSAVEASRALDSLAAGWAGAAPGHRLVAYRPEQWRTVMVPAGAAPAREAA